MSEQIVKLTGDWEKAKRIGGGELQKAMRRGMKFGILKAAGHIQVLMKLNVSRGRSEYAPLHPFTIEQKGSEQTLVNHGDMLNSITIQSRGDLRVMVGLFRGVKHTSGKPIVNIGLVHEFGATIPVTDAIRRALGFLGMFSIGDARDSPENREGSNLEDTDKSEGAAFTEIVIPPRPFVRPAWQEGRDEAGKLILRAIEKEARRLVS